MALTMKHIQSALDHFGRLRPTRLNLSAKRDFSLREAVLFMAPKLTEMKELGFTTRELVAALAGQEIIIKVPTLNRYLSEYQTGREKGIATETAATVPSDSKVGPSDEPATVQTVASAVSGPDSADRLKSPSVVSEDSERLCTDSV